MTLTVKDESDPTDYDQLLLHVHTDNLGGFIRAHQIATLDGMTVKILVGGGRDSRGQKYITISDLNPNEMAVLTNALAAIHKAHADTRPDPAGQSST